MCAAPSRESEFRVRIALQYLNSHYTQPDFCLSTLAREVGISPAHLSRLLAAHTGTGFRKQLRAVRMKSAADLLRDPRLSVKEVAAAVGYIYTSTFDRDFRAHFGINPIDYRCSIT